MTNLHDEILREFDEIVSAHTDQQMIGTIEYDRVIELISRISNAKIDEAIAAVEKEGDSSDCITIGWLKSMFQSLKSPTGEEKE